jgi:hypothetical protein
MPRKTRSNRRRQGRSTLRSKHRIHTFFLFQHNKPVVLAVFFQGMVNNKIYRRPVFFQNGLDYVSDKNMTEEEFNAAVKEQETFRKKGVAGGAVYRTTDKTPEQFAAIAKAHGGKDTPEWFVKHLEFVRDQTAKLMT